jgi:hypothetical protein
MLRFLQSTGKGSDRKLRLFACACCRRIGPWLRADRLQRAVETVESWVDGSPARRLQVAACVPAPRAAGGMPQLRLNASRPSAFAAEAVHALRLCSTAWDSAVECASNAARAARATTGIRGRAAVRGGVERAVQAALVREVFGPLPFRPVPLDEFWLRWNGGTVVKVARSIYDEGRFGDLPALANALEEAGCSDTMIIGHCRWPWGHVRGCWVLDLLLGKQ